MISQTLKELRKGKNMSIDELAKISGISNANISKIENNKVVPSADIVLKLSEIFECSTDHLLKGKNIQPVSIENNKNAFNSNVNNDDVVKTLINENKKLTDKIISLYEEIMKLKKEK